MNEVLDALNEAVDALERAKEKSKGSIGTHLMVHGQLTDVRGLRTRVEKMVEEQ